VLYAQFGEEVMPNEVLLALRKTFKYVYDQAYIHELYNVAVELTSRKTEEKEGAVRPLISPVCPVVNRLIRLSLSLPVETYHPGRDAPGDCGQGVEAASLLREGF
jgi:hypothetical protein